MGNMVDTQWITLDESDQSIFGGHHAEGAAPGVQLVGEWMWGAECTCDGTCNDQYTAANSAERVVPVQAVWRPLYKSKFQIDEAIETILFKLNKNKPFQHSMHDQWQGAVFLLSTRVSHSCHLQSSNKNESSLRNRIILASRASRPRWRRRCPLDVRSLWGGVCSKQSRMHCLPYLDGNCVRVSQRALELAHLLSHSALAQPYYSGHYYVSIVLYCLIEWRRRRWWWSMEDDGQLIRAKVTLKWIDQRAGRPSQACQQCNVYLAWRTWIVWRTAMIT